MVIVNDFGLNEELERITRMSHQPHVHPNDLISLISDFLQLQKSVVDAIREATKTARENQKEMVKVLENSISTVSGIIDRLSDKVESDEARMRLADISLELGNITREMSHMFERMNKENNRLWKFVIGGVLVIGGVSLLVILKSSPSKVSTAAVELDKIEPPPL